MADTNSDKNSPRPGHIPPAEERLAAEERGFAETRNVLRQFGAALRRDVAAASRRAGGRLRGTVAASKNARQRVRTSAWLRALRGVVAIAVACVMVVLAVLAWALRDIPWEEIAQGSLKPVVVLETADGEQLLSQGPYQGAYATRAEFPRHLVDAVISAEDRRFYDHFGIDPRGIARALFSNMRAGEIVEGGSTITQQLVKIIYLERDRTLRRKIQEAVIALWLERRLGKDEILTRYLNNVYLGAGATGMPAAARVYFDKEPRELDPGESAMLAGLIRAPSQLNPLQNPDGARQRTETVLDAMVADGRLDAAKAAEAKTQSAQLNPTRPATRSGSWLADWVIEEAREIAGPFRGTIKVRTSLMPRLQSIAEKAVSEALEREGAAGGASQAALVAMTPDGGVVAMVGGRDYDDSEFNRAVAALRQPGSAFKLFTYYAAIKAGVSLDDEIEDAPVKIGDWEPENFGGDYRGVVTVADAFAHSLNAATVALAMEVGIKNVIAAARELGIDAKLGETPSVALGTYGVSLLDLTGAYASVRAGHAPIQPWGIASFHADGQPRAFSVKAWQQPEADLQLYQGPLVHLLQQVVERGTGQAARLDGFAAGKTGTSQNFRDAWFIGFTVPLIAGVWVGNDDETPMNEVTGGRLPAQIWRNFMSEALAEFGGGQGEIAPPPTAAEEPPPVAVQEALPTVAEEEPAIAVENVPAAGGLDPTTTASVENATPVVATPGEEGPAACDYDICSRTYRSFRPSDCTYQPYDGPRRLCTASQDGTGDNVAAPTGIVSEVVEEAQVGAEEMVPETPEDTMAGGGSPIACNYRICSRFYSSFRSSDCTYQPYNGPRRFCDR
jgi:1A family penicillin-binding protein